MVGICGGKVEQRKELRIFKTLPRNPLESLSKYCTKQCKALVMSSYILNEEYEENTVSEVFLKGYRIGDKIIRHSMVKVAN